MFFSSDYCVLDDCNSVFKDLYILFMAMTLIVMTCGFANVKNKKTILPYDMQHGLQPQCVPSIVVFLKERAIISKIFVIWLQEIIS